MSDVVYVKIAPLPGNVREMVSSIPEDGAYGVIISERLCSEKRLAAYKHALTHIENEDFNNLDIQNIEKTAHVGA